MKKKKIFFNFKVKIWKDKQSNSWLVYCKKYKISAYGKTKTEAKKMFKDIINEILICSIPKKL